VSFQPAVSHVEVQLVNGCCGAVTELDQQVITQPFTVPLLRKWSFLNCSTFESVQDIVAFESEQDIVAYHK